MRNNSKKLFIKCTLSPSHISKNDQQPTVLRQKMSFFDRQLISHCFVDFQLIFVCRQSRVCQAKLSFSASLSDVYVKVVIEYTVGQPSIIIRPCVLSVGRQFGVEFF